MFFFLLVVRKSCNRTRNNYRSSTCSRIYYLLALDGINDNFIKIVFSNKIDEIVNTPATKIRRVSLGSFDKRGVSSVAVLSIDDARKSFIIYFISLHNTLLTLAAGLGFE